MESLQPKLRFSEFEGDWQTKKLDEISNINMGQSPSSTSYNTKMVGMPLIQGNADIKNRISLPRNWTSEPTKICEIGDLILTVRAPVGAIAKSNHKACIGRGVCSIKNKTNSNIDFIYQFLLDFENKWSALEQGSTFTAVSGNEIKNLQLNIPSIEEQTKIANFLSGVDEKLNLLNEKKALLEDYKKGIIQKIFSQEIRFKDNNGKDFKDWIETSLNDIGSFKVGGDLTKLDYQKEKSEVYKYPIYANGAGEGIYGYAKTYQYNSNCVTVSGRGNLGFANARTEKFNAIVRLIVIEPASNICPKFLEESINQIDFAIESTGVPQLTAPQIKNYTISVPSLDEQTKIANFLSAIDEKLDLVSNQIQDITEYKRGLLQQMFV